MGRNNKSLAVVQASCLFALSAGAAAENIFSVYSSSPDPRLHAGQGELRRSAGSPGVGLSPPAARRDHEPLSVPSYGLRFSHYPERHPNWGVGIDFTHYGTATAARAPGADAAVWRGALAPGATPLDRVGQRFEQPQGQDVLSVNGIWRWREEAGPGSRLQPYVGVGLAWYRSNTDGTMPGFARPPVPEGSGLGYHMLGGVRYLFTERAGAFFEAKFNSSNGLGAVPGDVDGSGGSYHAVAGVSYSF